ncbi:MAG: radical SAM protein, partial [Acidobacteriaceae bacterium]
VHVLGSFIFGLPTDTPATFDATVEMAMKAGVTFAQFVMMTPFPGTVDFGKWEKQQSLARTMVGDVPITRYWLIPAEVRPKMFTPHPSMSSDEIRERTQKVWDRFYNWSAIWERSACCPDWSSRLAFIFLSKLYRQMYAGTGISTDSARRKKSRKWARWTARQCKRLFRAEPMPELQFPKWGLALDPPRPAQWSESHRDMSPFVMIPKS